MRQSPIFLSLRAAGAAIPLNEVRHIERKRNIPPNRCPTRCHCEARSAAAIPWSKVRSVYRALFRWDRHAFARDDTENQLSLRRSVATAAISREGGGLRSICCVLFRWDISLALNMTNYFFVGTKKLVCNKFSRLRFRLKIADY